MDLIRSGFAQLRNLPLYAIGGINVRYSVNVRNVLLGVSATSLVMAFLEEKKRQEIIDRIALKKERMQMPVYELKDDELVNFPWNHDNLDEWLYRPVKVKGRKIERLEMNFETNYGVTPGATCMVPVVTKEDEERTFQSRNGIIVNLGWIPKYVINRHVRSTRYMDSDNTHEFVGILTEGERYRSWFGKKPNIHCEQLTK